MSYRTLDFIHYFRALLARYLAAVEELAAGEDEPAYSVPCRHCDMCHWRTVCEERRLADDHLSQVANISRQQVARLEAADITTLAQLATWPVASPIPRMNAQVASRLRSQAALQLEARQTGARRVELLPPDPDVQ